MSLENLLNGASSPTMHMPRGFGLALLFFSSFSSLLPRVPLFLSLSFSNLSVTLRLSICQCHSLSSPPPPVFPRRPALLCITGFPPLQPPILFHGNWLSMRGSGGGAGGGGGGGEGELLLERGGYVHYTGTECPESKRYT